MNAIKTEKLTKYYGQSRGVIDLDLQIEKGDFFGFIGPNGAGKSTTIRLLLGLISPSAGAIEILGKDISEYKTEILANVGYLPAEVAYYRGMRVSEIIEFSAKMRGKNCTDEAKSLCERLQLDRTRKVEELSLGNRKKVGIVCALQHKPELYIFDEPTSGLDPLVQKEFYDILKERNDSGAAIFLSSHNLSEVARYCKTAAIIKDGSIIVCDEVEKLGHTGVKKVTLRGVSSHPQIENAKNSVYENGNVTFLYSGSAGELVKALSQLQFEDINITDPELEEIFMHYYVKEVTV